MLIRKSILYSSIIAATIVITSCSKTDAPTSPTQSTKPDIPADVQAQMVQAEQYERLIQAMDPYVTQDASGAYVFDVAGFGAQHASLPTDDQKVVDELTGGIAVANQKIQEANQPGVAAKISTYYYWWGWKDCFSELSAVYMLSVLEHYAYPVWFWAQYYYYHNGRFCVCHPWVGGIWISS